MTPRRTRTVRAVGNPLVFLACAAFLAGTWHALSGPLVDAAVCADPLFVARGRAVYLPGRAQQSVKRLGYSRMFRLPYVFRSDPEGRSYTRHDFEEKSMDQIGPWRVGSNESPPILLTVSYVSFRHGAWAPTLSTSVRRSTAYHLPLESSGNTPAVDRDAYDRVLSLLPEGTARQMEPLRGISGGPERVLTIDTPIWWGYAWNAASIAALVLGLTSVACSPAWFNGVRARRRARRGACARCMYPLGTPSGTLAICPECGEKAASL